MKRYFPDMTAEEVAAANPFDLLMKVALKRHDEGRHEEGDEVAWEIMETVWGHCPQASQRGGIG